MTEQQSIQAWFAGRLPDDWFTGTPEVTSDNDEILVVGQLKTPDVAADANPSTGALMILDGDSFEVGGTALAAPIWAGLTALINASRSAASKPPLGLLNGRLYPLAQTDNFRDITMGSNGGFDAAAGYDLVTGLGAPVMSRLHPTLVAQP